MRITNTDERRFYEFEIADNGWTVKEFQRQFDTSLYERLALSRDKEKVRELTRKGQIIESPQDFFKNPLKHADIGQMQMYVNYYDRKVKMPDENPTIGIVLCKDKKDALVEMMLPEENNQIFAARYQTVLPSKEQLKKALEIANE
jgi:hypothetical protein